MRNWKMQDHGRNAFAAGATPLGELTALPRPLPGFKGPTSKGRGGEGREGGIEGREGRKGRGGEGQGKGREEKGRGVEGGRFDPPLFFTLRRRCIQ